MKEINEYLKDRAFGHAAQNKKLLQLFSHIFLCSIIAAPAFLSFLFYKI
jgi:hypothetical protein